jgi:hypothetical protein
MKTSTLPPLRVDPRLRKAAESVLAEGETLSGFVEASVRAQIERRLADREFIARGLASRDQARRAGDYVPSGQVLRKLEARQAKARSAAQSKTKSKARA